MASFSPKLLEKKYNNWIKAQLAMLFTKEGIEPFVCHEFQEFQLKCLSDICYNNGLKRGTSCSSCCTENVVKCPTNRICNKKHGSCNYHRNSATQYNPAGCPNKICHDFKTGIQNAHRYYGPSYKNTDATQWCSNPWEVAKCFMPPDGYKDVDCAKETDFNGIINVIINYKGFQRKVHENLDNKTNIFEQARCIGRKVRYSPTLEVDDKDLEQFFKVFQQLLSDTGYLAKDMHAQNAKQKLLHLENEALVIGKDGVKKVLYDAAKEVVDTISIEIDDLKKQYENGRAEIIQRKLDELWKAAEGLLQDIKEQGKKGTINMAANLAENLERKIFTNIKEDKEKHYYDRQKSSIESKQSYENIIKVWPAYREKDKNDVIFVVVTNKHVDSSKEINYNQDFEIVLQQKLETNDEDMLVLKHEFNTNSYIDDAKNKEIKAVIKKYSHTLRKRHKNLTMICASSLKSSGFLSGKHSMKSEDCIVLSVHIKGYIPLQEKCFPKMLHGFPVDVRENVFQMYSNEKPSDFFQNLKMGCEIGQNHKVGYGTIGGFIEHENHGLCLITCAHIFLGPEGLRESDTRLITCNQPSFKTEIGEIESERCGELKFHEVGTVTEGKACVDVAFVKIDTLRQPVNGAFPSTSSEDLMKSGFDTDYIPEYTSGKVYNTDEIIEHKRNRFIKYGATTLLRQGRYHSDGAFVILFGEITLENQLKIIDMDLEFAAEGDSGALVFCESDEGLVAAGLLEGGGKGYAIMTPICDILHAVGYSPPYALKTFPDANDNINGNYHIQENRSELEHNQGTPRSEGESSNIVRNRLRQRQAQVDEVVENMRVNAHNVLENDQQISDLDDRAELLQAGSSQCEASAGKRKFWWKSRQMWLFLLIGIIAVIFVIIIVWHDGGSDSKEASNDTTTVKSTR